MDRFSKHDTAVVKGIAALMLVCHHFFMGVLPAPIDWTNNDLWTIAATLSKVCVAIFVILSGYGINESRKKWTGTDFSFVKKHLKGLMKQFWVIFIIFVPLGFVCNRNPIEIYGSGILGIGNFILDFFGMKSLFNTPTMNQTWWYMEACIVLYILYPILKKLLNKIPLILFLITAIPVVKLGLLNDGSIDGCREIYWIFPFVMGMYLSQKDVLNKYSEFNCKNKVLCALATFVLVVIMTAIRSYFGIVADTFYALSIIAFSKSYFSLLKPAGTILGYIGKHSANIFMMHSFVYCYYDPPKKMFMVLGSGLANFILLMLICIAVSEYIEIVLKPRIFKNNKL